MTTAILWPTFALVALVFAVWVQVPFARLTYIKSNPPKRDDLATGTASASYFAPVDRPANNLANLFEMPVLFLALVPLLLITRHGGTIETALAWSFVMLRAAHSVVQTGKNIVRVRFLIYLVSCAVLAAMWLGFAIDIAVGR